MAQPRPLVIRMLRALLRLLWGITIGILLDIIDLLRRFFVALVRRSRRHPKYRKPHVKCIDIPGDVYMRPDPQLYCQSWLISLGIAVTWDNPDIWMEKGGVAVPSASLAPGTDYLVKVRVWNGSFRAPAIGLPVRLTYANFSFNGVTNFIGETFVDLPVRGAPGHPVIASIPWRTPGAPGHYCLYATLVWADDQNPLNNVGQENTNVIAAAPGQTTNFLVPLRNTAATRRRFRFAADAYQLPAAPYRFAGEAGKSAERSSWRTHRTGDTIESVGPLGGPDTTEAVARQRDEVVKRNALGAFPIPAEWTLEMPLDGITLAEGETRDVAFSVTPAANARSGDRIPFNIYAFNADGTSAGGVTIIVEVQ